MAAKKKRTAKVKVIVVAEYGISLDGADYDKGDTMTLSEKEAKRLHSLSLVNPV